MGRKTIKEKTQAEKRLSDETKWNVVFLKKQGKLSNQKIAEQCKVSPSSVTNLWEKYKETGNVKERNDRRTGAPRKTTPRQDRALIHSSQCDRFKTVPQHRRDHIAMGTRLSLATIKRCLAEANLNGRVARKKPLITKVNTEAASNTPYQSESGLSNNG